MTAVAVSTATEAQVRAERIRAGVRTVLEWQADLKAAWIARDWEALGYPTWSAYTSGEFGEHRISLPVEMRREMVAGLRAIEGSPMSTRAIADAIGVGQRTVVRDLQSGESPDSPGTPAAAAPLLHALEDVAAEFGVDLGDDDEAADLEAEVAAALSEPEPEPAATVTGTDGKTYTAASKRTPYRKPLPDVAKDKGFALRQSMDAVERLFDDNRYRGNEKQVALALRGHLLHVQDRVSALLDQLP